MMQKIIVIIAVNQVIKLDNQNHRLMVGFTLDVLNYLTYYKSRTNNNAKLSSTDEIHCGCKGVKVTQIKEITITITK